MSYRERLTLDLTKPVRIEDLDVAVPRRPSAPDIDPSNLPREVETRPPAKRKTRSRRRTDSFLQEFESFLGSETYAQAVRIAAEVFEYDREGAPYVSTPSSVAALTWLTIRLGSEAAAIREARDDLNWLRLRRAARRAWAEQPEMHLARRRPPTRDSHRYMVQKLKEAGLYDGLHDLLVRDARSASRYVMGTTHRSYTNPGEGNVFAGDGFWLLANTGYQPGMFGTRHDGSRYMRRFDATARQLGKVRSRNVDRELAPTDDRRVAMGVHYVLTLMRNRHANERVITGIRPVPDGKTESEVFVDSVLESLEEMPWITVAVYDMALRWVDADRLYAAGVIPMTKIPRQRNGKVDTANLGPHTVRLSDGTERKVTVFTIDGHAGILVSAAGDEWFVPLGLKQVRRGHNTMYGEYEIPPDPHVDQELHGASVRIRGNSTPAEKEAGIHRSAHLRFFPEQHPVFERLFGIREDTESAIGKLKMHLRGRRLRTVDAERNLLDLHFWMLIENNVARAAHRDRLLREAHAPPDGAAKTA